MPTVTFIPAGVSVNVEPNTKLLVAATKHKVAMRYGCAACRCGTCGVLVAGVADLTPMKDTEAALLAKMGLTVDGSVRLACQARIMTGDVVVDLRFQDSYSPDFDEDE